MIFVTVGSQKYQFNRLLEWIDQLVNANVINKPVFAQTGYSDYIPKKYKYRNFIDRKELNEILSKCDVVITHGGTGAIISALKQNKIVIVVPRNSEYKEHVDNHQYEIASCYEGQKMVLVAEDFHTLKAHLLNSEVENQGHYISNTKVIIESIDNFISQNCRIN